MVGRVQHNGNLHSLRSHQHTQSAGEAGYLGNRIITRTEPPRVSWRVFYL